MSLPAAVERCFRRYLDQVASRLAHLSPEARRDVLSALERQLHDTLSARTPHPTPEDAEGVLAGMDPPESYASSGEDAAPPPASRRGTPGWAWWLLGLAFLGLNGWAVFRRAPAANPPGEVVFTPTSSEAATERRPLAWTFNRPMVPAERLGAGDPSFPPASLRPDVPGVFTWENPQRLIFTPKEPWPPAREFVAHLAENLADAQGIPWTGRRTFTFRSEPLALRFARQNMLVANRTLVLRLAFNTAPDPNDLVERVRVETPDGVRLPWERIGKVEGADIYLRLLEVQAPQVRVRVSKGLRPQQGELPLDHDAEAMVPVQDELRFEGLTPETPSFGQPRLVARFNDVIAAETARDFIEIRPPVDVVLSPRDEWYDHGLLLEGNFIPGQAYTLTFRAGLKARGGYELAETIQRISHFPDRPPALAIPADGRYLSPRGRLQLPFSAINVRGGEATLQPVPPRNIAAFVLRETGQAHRYYGYDEADHAMQLAGSEITRALDAAGPPNEEIRRAVALRSMAADELQGIYLLTLTASNAPDTSRLIVVTDLGLSARVGTDKVWVWATHLRTAAPATGVDVSLLAENGDSLAQAQTDTDGVAQLSLDSASDERQPLLILAAEGKDVSFLPLVEATADPAESGGRAFTGGQLEAYLFTDRGIYRPGETAHIQLLARDAAVTAPTEAFPIRVRIRRPDGRVVHETTLMLDENGAAETSLTMAERWPTGRFSIEATLPGSEAPLGQTVIMLEEFVPPQITAVLEGPEGRVAAHEKQLPLSLKARHLFGRPADGLPVSSRAYIEPAPFAPNEWKGWIFGDAEKTFPARGQELPKQRLNENGETRLAVALDPAWRPPAALRVRTSATVIEPGGRPITTTTDSLVDAYPYYLGLRSLRETAVLRVGQAQSIQVAGVRPEGQLDTEIRGLKVILARAEWISYLARNDENQYRWKSERRVTPLREDVLTLKEGRGEWSFSPDHPGHYVLTFADPLTGVSSSLSFDAAEPQQTWADWSRERPDLVELSLDRPSYQPGDTARLLIKAPFAGTAWLTIENDEVQESVVSPLTGNTATVSIPVREGYLPNVHCRVSVVRPAVGESVWSAHRAAGSMPLAVTPPGRRLMLDIAAPETARPMTPLPVRITARDEDGQPARATVTLAAVDEGICLLTDFQTPDPLKWFLALRRMALAGYSMFQQLLPEMEDAAGGPASHTAGDMADSLLRRLSPMRANRFKPVALWRSQLQLDSNGVAQTELLIPEFTGELRLMAVAYNRRQAGSAQKAVLIRRPLAVQTGLPRFLAPNDACRVPLTVFNDTGADIEARVQLTCSGPLTAELATQSLVVKQGGQGEVALSLQASGQPGTGLVCVEVTGGGEIYRETFELAVRPAAVLTTKASTGIVEPGGEVRLSAPAGWLPDTVRLTVRAGGQPEVRLAGGLDYLLNYPYGCLEQTTSACFPLLYLADLVNLARPGSIGAEETDRYLQAGILRVLDMQQAHGGFSSWPRGTDTWAWGSLYAGHFLLEARRAGHAVPEDRIEALLGWIRKRLEARPVEDAAPGQREWLEDGEERAYACHLLALAGQPDPGWTERLREQSALLSLGARAHVAAALLYSGRPRDARTLLESIGLEAPVLPRTNGRVLAGGGRETALLLATWLEADPAQASVATLAQRLDAAQEEGYWGATYDTALAIMALGKYARYAAKQKQPLAATFHPEGGASMEFSEASPLAWNSPRPGEELAGRLENKGPGPLYYTALFEGVPAAEQVEETDSGLRVRREWLDANAEPWPDDQDIHVGDLILVRLTLETTEPSADNVVVTDLLPAGLELENPNLATSAVFPGLAQRTDAFRHRDMRDDRLLLFSSSFSGTITNHYALRAVTAGRYVLPAVAADGMYDPALRSLHGRQVIEVQP